MLACQRYPGLALFLSATIVAAVADVLVTQACYVISHDSAVTMCQGSSFGFQTELQTEQAGFQTPWSSGQQVQLLVDDRNTCSIALVLALIHVISFKLANMPSLSCLTLGCNRPPHSASCVISKNVTQHTSLNEQQQICGNHELHRIEFAADHLAAPCMGRCTATLC